MSRLLAALAVTLALAGCSRKPEVVDAAPVAPPAPQAAMAPMGQAPAPQGATDGNQQLPPGHPPIDGGMAAPGPAVDQGQAAQGQGMDMQQPPPHGGAMSTGDEVPDVKVPKASGKDARTVAELFSQRQALKDKTVTVRGKVVKYTPGVMGKNWIHLRDGTGTPGKDNDVTVTTQDPAAKGDVVVVKGTVSLDQNIGMGTPYPIIIQDAKVSK
jgi:hypothetical protein